MNYYFWTALNYYERFENIKNFEHEKNHNNPYFLFEIFSDENFRKGKNDSFEVMLKTRIW